MLVKGMTIEQYITILGDIDGLLRDPFYSVASSCQKKKEHFTHPHTVFADDERQRK